MNIKIVLFDAEGVIFDLKESAWQFLFKELNLQPAYVKLRKEFEKGNLTYIEWSNRACKILKEKGLSERKFLQVINSIPFAKGAKEVIGYLRYKGYVTGIISGSFWSLLRRVENVSYRVAHCHLIFKNGKLERWKLVDCDYEGKVKWASKIAEQLNLSLRNVAYIGNDLNDIPLLRKVGLAIVVKPKREELRKFAHMVLDNIEGLRKIL